jgi:rhamnulose-1-phosphate aldolase
MSSVASSGAPSLPQALQAIGEVGRRLCEIAASEGAAGNISCFGRWDEAVEEFFPHSEPLELPSPMPELAGGVVIATGSGRRLREVTQLAQANLGAVRILGDGCSARLHTAPQRLFERLTSEFNSHLAVHRDCVGRENLDFHALVHAQPVHLTYLSHIGRYQDERYLNRHILRWEPEGIVTIPEGVGFLPFEVPGSDALMQANVASLRTHRIVLWAKHGVMARSNQSVKKACDLIEYAETGAFYEYLNLTNHGLAEGLSDDEIHRVCAAFNIQQNIF